MGDNEEKSEFQGQYGGNQGTQGWVAKNLVV